MNYEIFDQHTDTGGCTGCLAADKKVSAAKAAGTANHMGVVSIVQSSLLFYRGFVTNVTQEIDF